MTSLSCFRLWNPCLNSFPCFLAPPRSWCLCVKIPLSLISPYPPPAFRVFSFRHRNIRLNLAEVVVGGLFPICGSLDGGAVRQRDDWWELVARDVGQWQ